MKIESQKRRLGFIYVLTIFLSAFLLFQVQPLISKSILPWFGGTPAVWTTCMLFFQVVLFGGYLYAHLTTQRLSPRRQGWLHIGLLLVALAMLPIMPDTDWKPQGGEEPVLRIVLLLAVTVGLPFFILSATGPLLQGWFSRTHAGTSPYRLYALSNLGSLLALISYPFVFEPAFATWAQAVFWSWGFAGFALCCSLCAVAMSRHTAQTIAERDGKTVSLAEEGTIAPPTLGTRALWFGLATAASVMLLATTNQVCMDVASVPFLWVLPLTLYLISFILCFDSDRWYSRRLFAIAFAVSMATVTVVMLKGAGGSLVAQVVVYFSGLFFCAMVCHGELVRLKPHPRYLTSFYLVISAGGAAGGLFVGLLAPLIFPAYLELHLGILGSVVLALIVFFRDRSWVLHGGQSRWIRAAVLVGVVALAAGLQLQADESLDDAIAVSRNFYGVLRVKEEEAGDPNRHHRTLMHGRIVHGLQFQAENKRLLPTAYYGRNSGAGRLLRAARVQGPIRVGVVGLGVGTLATYGRPGDSYRFYEINPEVIRLAERYFTFLTDCQAQVEHIVGDARLSLEHEPSQQFDVLILDAFSGDAIPAHLLTREAGEIYRRHLKPEGVLAVHISNLHFDLRPVVTGLGEHLGLVSSAVFSKRNDELGTKNSLWMVLSRDADRLQFDDVDEVPLPPNDRRILWTDHRSNLFEILR